MKNLRFDFVEDPQNEAHSSDLLLPHLSALSKEKLNLLRGGVEDCDAVCLPPGYDYDPPCNCLSNLCANPE